MPSGLTGLTQPSPEPEQAPCQRDGLLHLPVDAKVLELRLEDSVIARQSL
jgi:hypothetical protein